MHDNKKKTIKKLKYVLAGIFIIAAGVFYVSTMKGQEYGSEIQTEYEDETDFSTCVEGEGGTENETEETLCVYVCGQVNNPGVYYLKAGERVHNAILLAGGLTGEADYDSLNQAETVRDGQKIYVPCPEEEMSGESGDTLTESGLININTADSSSLQSLPGIGEARALAIIAYRENDGYFETIEDIKKVSGIKDAAFEKIKNLICV